MKLFRKIRAKMLSNKKVFNYMLYAIGEIALIVIGILLALYLQNRNEENKIQETVNTTISLLRDEITTNKKNILNAIDYHTMVRDTLQKIEMPKTVDEINRALSFWRGMQTPKLQDAAFQTGIQSGVNGKLDPLVLIALNELYTHQESYNELNAASAQIFLMLILPMLKILLEQWDLCKYS